MIQYIPADLSKRTENRRRLEARRYAANWRLWHSARREHEGWLASQRHSLLRQVGRTMVEWGQRLQKLEIAPRT
jgi:hypothetical protein